MKKIITLAIVLVAVICLTHTLGAQSFDDYKQQEEKEFNQYDKQAFKKYRAELLKEFQLYKDIADREFKKYKNEIRGYWKKAEVSNQKRWVEYSSDYKTRRIVDFEKGQINIEIITDKNSSKLQREEQLKATLADLIGEDKKTAFGRDRLSQNVEKELIKAARHIKTDTVKRDPILAPILMDKHSPSPKDIAKKAAKLIKKATVKTRPSTVKGKEVVSAKIKLPSKSILKKAAYYKSTIENHASKRKIDSALVFAVIHTESAFNPLAKSHAPAYGLMQIVPRSAGMEVTKFLYGKSVLLAPSYLYNDENNINIGSTYLHILYHRYMRKIKNPESRLYCSIAAYNTGPGNVARAFTGKRSINKAISVINKMTSDEVYKKLRTALPYEETRHYVKRVADRIDIYSSI